MNKLIKVFVFSWLVVLLSVCSHLVSSTELVNEEAQAGLIFSNEQGKTIASPLLSSDVKMNVNGLINRVTVKQVFKNESNQWINANYIFPLPEKAALDHLRLKIGERVIEGIIKPTEQAKKIYQKAKISGKKASLITQQRTNIFTTQVANIAPFETVEVEIEYQQTVLYRDGQFSLHYPMTITPRYAPPTKLIENDDFLLYNEAISSPQSMENTTLKFKIDDWILSRENSELATKTIESIASKNDPDLLLNLSINIISPIALENINSAYHKITKNILSEHASPSSNEKQYVISLNEPVIANQDFVLSWKVNASDQNNAYFLKQNIGNTQYGQLMFLPAQNTNQEANVIYENEDSEEKIFDKDILFVIDTSGSMSGSSMQQAKAALQYGIEQLNIKDRFNVIDFNDNAKLLSGSFLIANSRSKKIAKGYIDLLNASGGTNMMSALSLVLATKPKGQKKLQQIIFITDASISNEDQLLEKIRDEITDQRLFMVGIGSASNRYFMTRGAEFGKGSYTYIGKTEEVKEKISNLFNKIASPVLQDINITWQDGSTVDYWPKPVSDLYQSEAIQLVLKIPENKQNQSISLSAYELKNGNKTLWMKTLNVNEQLGTDKEIRNLNNNMGIAPLWAREKIDSISLDKQYTNVQKQSLITELGLQHHIVTKFTSLVAVDKTPIRPIHLKSEDLQIKTMLPKGSQQRLPQTGFASDWLMKTGLLLQLLTLIAWLLKDKSPLFLRFQK
jgi:Ca-activated chloride channel family protein